MTELHKALAASSWQPGNPAYGSILRRAELTLGDASNVPAIKNLHGKVRIDTTPPINRAPMAPKPWPLKFGLRRIGRKRHQGSDSPDPDGHWHRNATRRHVMLFVLIVVQTLLATASLTATLPYQGRQPTELAILCLFAVLFGWISAGFWTALMGFVLLLSKRDRYAISRTAAGNTPISEDARTAIVMPICNENVPRVFAGLRATYDSLQRTGALERFDFFVLSDSADPDTRVAEKEAWFRLCREIGGFGRVFYRWRQHRIKRKSGNVADFCRRWGNNYRYMVVLDADSVMSGDCLTTLVRLMQANPNAGIIQTAPRASGRETLYARVQQFANRVYGPLFTAGLHFWELGEAHYWGHNAIIRVAPFIRHCAIGRLPGRGALSGEILSHDFVEAALMRRAGWAVWIAYDLPGSYEEMPPNLIDELKRDRRWCQGNLINSRLFLAEGMHASHRAVFATGVMAYLSAPLWFLFLVLSTALLAMHTLAPPQYFTQPKQLFPDWPRWDIGWAIALATATATLLFMPKILATLLAIIHGTKNYGGALRLAASTLFEMLFSMLLAPVRMLFHTQFVVSTLMGRIASWKSPPRDDTETTWREAVRRHGWHTLLGLAWAGGVYWLSPSYLWWLLPVVSALILSIPISVLSSRVSLGQRLRRAGMFLIPEESAPPPELAQTRIATQAAAAPSGFIDAAMVPTLNALVCAVGVARGEQSGTIHHARSGLVQRALRDGPDAVTKVEKSMLLNDPISMSQLHFEVWTSFGAHPVWRDARKFIPTTLPPPERPSA
ncbi:MAG TPA: glucans biosynthesis glucosyltransferase MdoH, partial [Burkholderiales bacterium]|nr:glucans biosynthesis glucosyltransferase MdoH [Burkholderiales bacterium]